MAKRSGKSSALLIREKKENEKKGKSKVRLYLAIALIILGIIGIAAFFANRSSESKILPVMRDPDEVLETMNLAYVEWKESYECDQSPIRLRIMSDEESIVTDVYGNELQMYASAFEDIVKVWPYAPDDIRSMTLHEVSHVCIGSNRLTSINLRDLNGTALYVGDGLSITAGNHGDFDLWTEMLAERVAMTFPNYQPNPTYAGMVVLSQEAIPDTNELIQIARDGDIREFIKRHLVLPESHEVTPIDYMVVVQMYLDAFEESNK